MLPKRDWSSMALADVYRRMRQLAKDNSKITMFLGVTMLLLVLVIISVAVTISNREPKKGILLIGGKRGNKIYDTVTIFHPDYTKLGHLPPLLMGRAKHLSCALGGSNIAVFGGRQLTTALSSVEVYSMETHEWSNDSFINYPLYGAVGGLIGTNYIICGGIRIFHLHKYYKKCLKWNMEFNSMELHRLVPDMLVDRGYACSAVSESTLYVFGGWKNGSVALNTMEMYSPDTNKWMQGPPMPRPITHCAAASLADGIYVCGGYPPPVGCFRYSTTSATWSIVKSMKVARFNHQMVAFGGKIFAFMGNIETNLWAESSEVFDPVSGEWTILGRTFQGLEGFSAAVLT